MTVYVDDMRLPARVGRVTGRWSHLLADSRDELVAFAEDLGLRPTWIQHAGSAREHFDVTDRVRERALQRGAVAISYPRGTAAIIRSKGKASHE